ncbi:MAG: glycosyltransferase family 4 protein [Flavipsychrobacter sp.]|nr:glycosyltransferase family 4 protein [Flavipsychrobacter sp.]
MRVLHLVKTATGATWAYRQIKVLVAQGAEVAVCLPAGKMAELYKADGIQVYEFTFSINPVKMLVQLARFRTIIRDFRPDIVHSHFIVTTLFARLYRFLGSLRVPLVFQVPGPLHLEHSFFRNADLKTANRNDYWIGTCHWTSKQYVTYGKPGNHVFMSFYGTDMSFVKKHPPGKLRAELGFGADDFVVAMVAYMYKPKKYIGQKRGIKGHEDFFEGVAKCLREHSGIKIVVIGGAWEGAQEYEKQLEQMGKELCGAAIHFLGSRPDVPELYADIDLVVHPSYSENLGGAAESLLLEVPTIATNVGGFPDVVLHGETGLLVNPGAPDEIAEAVNYAFGHREEMKQMARAGRQRLLSLLDVNNTGKEVYDIYNRILKTTPENVQVYQKAV